MHLQLLDASNNWGHVTMTLGFLLLVKRCSYFYGL